jgi:hypothetical protein
MKISDRGGYEIIEAKLRRHVKPRALVRALNLNFFCGRQSKRFEIPSLFSHLRRLRLFSPLRSVTVYEKKNEVLFPESRFWFVFNSIHVGHQPLQLHLVGHDFRGQFVMSVTE